MYGPDVSSLFINNIQCFTLFRIAMMSLWYHLVCVINLNGVIEYQPCSLFACLVFFFH